MAPSTSDDGRVAAGSPAASRRFAVEMLGGTVGGVLQVIVGHPLDTMKVRLQSVHGAGKYTGMADCARQTVQQEGLRGFYRGMASPLAMAGILNGVMFSVNGQMKRLVAWRSGKTIGELNVPEVVAAALLTAPVYCAVLAPTELVKARLQFQTTGASQVYGGPLDVIRKVHAEAGVRGLWQGYGVTVGTRIVGAPFYFVTYDVLSKHFKGDGREDVPRWKVLVAGGLAGVAFWTGNFPGETPVPRPQPARPRARHWIACAVQSTLFCARRSCRSFRRVSSGGIIRRFAPSAHALTTVACAPTGAVDALKTRVQTQTGVPKSVGSIAREMWAEGGVRTFYRGYAPCILRAFPANAAVFFGLELTLRGFGYDRF